METTEPNARNAAPSGARNSTHAFRSKSTKPGFDGIAGIVGGIEASTSRLSARAAEWAESECHISRETLEPLGVASGTTFFPGRGLKCEALFFRYSEGWKARALDEKAFVACIQRIEAEFLEYRAGFGRAAPARRDQNLGRWRFISE